MRRWTMTFSCLALLVLAACATPTADQQSSPTQPAEDAAALRLYTTVTQDTVDAVVAEYTAAHPNVDVEVFRAPTGELNARIAAEQREGKIRADVLWLTDPLSMEQYASAGMLATPPEAAVAAVDERFASDAYVGTRILNMVVVHHDEVAPPERWEDLAELDADAPVALPDPGFAGSALGALGYFALDGGGLEFYERLEAAGAVQVQAPDEVTTGVAEGRFSAGMTLDNSARTAREKGSPVQLAAPEPGAVAIVSPIGVVQDADNAGAAGEFVSFVVTQPAQEAIAATGWQPVLDSVEWEHDLPQVFPDWEAIAARQDELLEEYRTIFGG